MKPSDSVKPSDGQLSGATAGVWRAIDASANRAGEALRAVEDMVRFVLDDGQLTRLVKDLRHDLAGALADGLADRVFLRDVGADVGVGVAAAAPLHRFLTSGDAAAFDRAVARLVGADCRSQPLRWCRSPEGEAVLVPA
jgi:hypothetical protein